MPEQAVVLMTAARNEGPRIGRTLRSIGAQTLRPRLWVVVSDGSVDETDAVVAEAARTIDFLRFTRRDGSARRTTASKVEALAEAQALLRDVPHDFIGNIDADIEVEPDFLERICARFAAEPELGIAAGWVHERRGGRPRPRAHNDARSAPGCTQVFRRACFEAIGGYRPLRYGGEDSTADVMARLAGWTVRAFPDIPVLHLHPAECRAATRLRAAFRQGREDYFAGGDFGFEVLKCAARWRERPPIASAFTRLAGFAAGAASREPVAAPPEAVRFLRREQRARLAALARPNAWRAALRRRT